MCAVREELNQRALLPLQTNLHSPSEWGRKNGMEMAWLIRREALALLLQFASRELPWDGGASLWQGMMGCCGLEGHGVGSAMGGK